MNERVMKNPAINAQATPLHPFFSEKSILFPVLILSGIGIIMVYSASAAISIREHDTLFFFMKKQIIYSLIAVGIMLVTASLPYRLYKSMAYIILFAAFGLLIAVLIPALNLKGGGGHPLAAAWGPDLPAV